MSAAWTQLGPDIEGRVLHFVRHGQYESAESGSGRLTPLGERQAERVARYFAGLPVAAIRSSDLPRAVQTADIVAARLGVPSVSRHRMLREALPTHVRDLRVPRVKREADLARVERIVARLFAPARQTRHEIVVCHGNLIRAVALRVTAGRVNGWERLRVHHTSISSFVVCRRYTQLLSYNNIAHLPPSWRTFM
jgi:broad specificity phosphatase PhoE